MIDFNETLPPEYKLASIQQPKLTWEIKLNNVVMAMADPIPNRFQCWMMEKCFNVKVTVYDTNK